MVSAVRNRTRGDVIKLPQILIVDDNVEFAFSLGEILRDENYEVECVHTGEAAVELFPQRDFDIVLLDMKLPRMSGVEVLFELRGIKPDIEVLMMSGHSVTDLLAQAVNGGAHRIFYPPYRFESLLSGLRAMTGEGLVLVVDGTPGLAANIQQALSSEGRSVLVARERAEAIEKLSPGEHDLLVLDLGQKSIRGLEVYWELGKQARTVPSIILAPAPTDDYVTIQKLNQFPICGYFIKPFDPLELLPVLESLTR